MRAQLWFAAGLLETALRHRRVPDLVMAAGHAAGSPAARWYPAGRLALTGPRLDELAADAGAFWRGDSACLSRSLLRGWLAATAGRSVDLVVRVRRRRAFAAHTWLEVDGAVHAEEREPTLVYHPVASYPLTDQRRPPR
ncbi:lasso peptide biosynthesis B2 protein [Pseudofrankia sp. DC12]|uniref:lasso peptide biosynthesis B2 protein n=1 Tax=Pseudofrankia sp. DC12 TaxID=683315 RepID=UPI000B2752B7|nr:lasso peptide biosynthesis B2 protein [Pseudofrankia sp. DC12]